ncbi:unnamed protein product, partial [Symbiodinium sp. KB8]
GPGESGGADGSGNERGGRRCCHQHVCEGRPVAAGLVPSRRTVGHDPHQPGVLQCSSQRLRGGCSLAPGSRFLGGVPSSAVVCRPCRLQRGTECCREGRPLARGVGVVLRLGRSFRDSGCFNSCYRFGCVWYEDPRNNLEKWADQGDHVQLGDACMWEMQASWGPRVAKRLGTEFAFYMAANVFELPVHDFPLDYSKTRTCLGRCRQLV